MDDQTESLSRETDEEFRSAVAWWIRLRDCGSDLPTLREFSRWLEQDLRHPRAFAELGVLWYTVESAIAALPAAGLSQPAAPGSSEGRR